MEGLFKEFYLGSTGLWLQSLDGMTAEMRQYGIDEH